MNQEFTPIVDPYGIRVRDPIENAQFVLYTDRVVDPVESDTDQFVLPVDSAVSVRVSELEVPQTVNVMLWSADGTLLDEFVSQKEATFEAGWYALDIPVSPLNLQVVADGPLTLRHDTNSTFVEFPAPTTVHVGTRSLHKSPAGSITIGDDIEDAFRAVSLASSALKTTSPERSFPSLRGHPPLIERGDGFDAPDAFERPDTDVTLEIQPTYADLYRVSPLAYYLGAEVVPGDERVLDLAGDRYALDTDRGFESEVATLLKHVFLLDCVTRTEGFYTVDLHERREIEDDLTFDLAEAYDAPLVDRLGTYLSVPYDVTMPHVPQWKLNADIDAVPDHLEAIPFVMNELATVRIPGADEEPNVHAEPAELTSFYRSTEPGTVVRAAERSAAENVTSGSSIVKPDETDAIEHAWFAEGFPLGASKMWAESYLRRFDRPEVEKESISIDIVCNEPEMDEEDIVEEFYGTRDIFEFQIDVHYELAGDELSEILRKDTDFLHYIGHVDEDGFQCSDGMFDARTLQEVNVDAFLLNACKSYEQGAALVENGSYGGIVTLANVSNDPAVRIGRALARLLNMGFSLQAGLSVARNVTLFGSQYITIGDATLQLVHNINGTPLSLDVTPLSEGYEVTMRCYPTVQHGMGTLFTPHMKRNSMRYLNSGVIDTFELTEAELRETFTQGLAPVLFDGELTWSDELLENELG